ncbi:MAG: hypothetical protein RLZZ505_3337 [Verrucomicrobiota bacterium]|jgi:hypothetical protein
MRLKSLDNTLNNERTGNSRNFYTLTMNTFDTKAHANLLAEWAQRSPHAEQAFYPDGVIEPEKWANAPIKILFLNKEAHDSNNPDTEGFDLTRLIREKMEFKSYRSTYRNTAVWAYAIHKAVMTGSAGLPRWDKILDSVNDEVENSFHSCAIVNIKKSGGVSISIDSDLEKYVELDKDLLRRQIDLINPDLIIAGSVWSLVKDLWPDCEELFDAVHQHRDTVIIDFWHPANRADEQMKYYALDSFLRNSGILSKFRNVIV